MLAFFYKCQSFAKATFFHPAISDAFGGRWGVVRNSARKWGKQVNVRQDRRGAVATIWLWTSRYGLGGLGERPKCGETVKSGGKLRGAKGGQSVGWRIKETVW